VKLLAPKSLEEALAMLAADAEIVPIAGGTDLLVDWPSNLDAHTRTYLDLSALEPLRAHRLNDHSLVLGALSSYWQVIEDAAVTAAFPLLASAARQVGAVQIQTRGTWAGNVANASPAADGVPVLMAYDARVELVYKNETETVPLAAFYTGYKQMRRTSGQLIRALHLPRRRYKLERFVKVGARRAQAIAKLGVAITCSGAGWRVVASSVAPTVCRCPALERLLASGAPIRCPEDLLPAIDRDTAPIDDLRSTADYRRRVLARVLFATLTEEPTA